jgi:hypothetical protein
MRSGKLVTEPSKQRARPRSVTANPSIVAAGFSDGETWSPSYRTFRTNIRLGSTLCRKTLRTAPTAEALGAICDLGLSELESIVPPRGFGRD